MCALFPRKHNILDRRLCQVHNHQYLFEIIGLYPATDQAEPSSPDSLAQTLLRRLGLAEDSGTETKVTKDYPHESEAMGADAVK
jgi:hypothetical protein